jgi:hypothetical protein
MIHSPAYVSKGEYLQLKMFLPDIKTPLSVEMGVVRWTHGPRFGVEFIKMSGPDRALLAQFISKHQRSAWTSRANETERSYSETSTIAVE